MRSGKAAGTQGSTGLSAYLHISDARPLRFQRPCHMALILPMHLDSVLVCTWWSWYPGVARRLILQTLNPLVPVPLLGGGEVP